MFNGISSDEQDTRNVEEMFANSNQKVRCDVNRDTLNPKNFHNSFSDEECNTLIIPRSSNENVKDTIFKNVCNNAELVISRRNSKCQEFKQKEEEKYTEDVLGWAKKLLFSDLSLASWSNKDISVSMHSNIIDYQVNNKENTNPNQNIKNNEETPKKLKFDDENIFNPKVDDEEFSQELSQNSILFSPMNLKHYQLPLDEVDEFKKSKIYDSKYINFDWFEMKNEKLDHTLTKNKHKLPEVVREQQKENSNFQKPFEYIETNATDLKEWKGSDDSTAYGRYFTKCTSMKKSRIESEKVSPHQFQNWLIGESPDEASFIFDGDKASENFSQVHEDEIESAKYVPQEPPKKTVYSGLVKSPHMLADASKKTFDYSKTKEELLGLNENSKICKTQEDFKIHRKYKDLNINHKNTVNSRLANTFKNISKNGLKDKSKGKLKSAGDAWKFNYVGSSKLRFRHLSSVSSTTFSQVPKSNISFKSRNRDSSVGSGDFRSIIKSIQIDPESTRNNHIFSKYKIVNRGFLTQRSKSKNSPNSPSIFKIINNKKIKKLKKDDQKESKKNLSKPKKESKSQRRNDSKNSRDNSVGQRTTNVLYGLKNKLKVNKGIKTNKSRAHSTSEFRAFVHTFKTERSTLNHPLRSISSNRHDIKSSFKQVNVKHKRNTKVISSSSSTINMSKLNKNPSFISVGIVPKTITHVTTPKHEEYKGCQFSKKQRDKQIKSHVNLPRF